jgi:hypothetical protein
VSGLFGRSVEQIISVPLSSLGVGTRGGVQHIDIWNQILLDLHANDTMWRGNQSTAVRRGTRYQWHIVSVLRVIESSPSAEETHPCGEWWIVSSKHALLALPFIWELFSLFLFSTFVCFCCDVLLATQDTIILYSYLFEVNDTMQQLDLARLGGEACQLRSSAVNCNRQHMGPTGAWAVRNGTLCSRL